VRTEPLTRWHLEEHSSDRTSASKDGTGLLCRGGTGELGSVWGGSDSASGPDSGGRAGNRVDGSSWGGGDRGNPSTGRSSGDSDGAGLSVGRAVWDGRAPDGSYARLNRGSWGAGGRRGGPSWPRWVLIADGGGDGPDAGVGLAGLLVAGGAVDGGGLLSALVEAAGAGRRSTPSGSDAGRSDRVIRGPCSGGGGWVSRAGGGLGPVDSGGGGTGKEDGSETHFV